MPAVLLVTRDASVRQLVQQALTRVGYEVVAVEDAESAKTATLNVKCIAVMLDCEAVPDDVEEISDWVRTGSENPVGLVFLMSPRTPPGALPIDPERDPLIVKPLAPEQIQPAIELAISGAAFATVEKLVIGRLEMDRPSGTVRSNDTSVALTPTEFQLLEYLAMNTGRFVSAHELLEKVWQRNASPGSAGVVRTHVQNLRMKLAPIADGRKLIKTYARRGYLLAPPGGSLHRLQST